MYVYSARRPSICAPSFGILPDCISAAICMGLSGTAGLMVATSNAGFAAACARAVLPGAKSNRMSAETVRIRIGRTRPSILFNSRTALPHCPDSVGVRPEGLLRILLSLIRQRLLANRHWISRALMRRRLCAKPYGFETKICTAKSFGVVHECSPEGAISLLDEPQFSYSRASPQFCSIDLSLS